MFPHHLARDLVAQVSAVLCAKVCGVHELKQQRSLSDLCHLNIHEAAQGRATTGVSLYSSNQQMAAMMLSISFIKFLTTAC